MAIVNFEIRRMTLNDLDSVCSLENSLFISPWKRSDFEYEIKENQFANISVIEVNGVVVGYYDYWHTFDSVTICKIAVNANLQRQHLGSELMKDILADCYAKKVSSITLEVRKSNEKAINLYKKFGFRIILTKEKYYSNGEDAYYMVKEVDVNV